MKRVLAFLLFFSGLGFGQAADIYLNPTGVGLCAGHAVTQTQTFFNTSTNWGSGPTQIGPGTTVHICGAFISSTGTAIFTFQGSGSLANPITFKLESGARVSGDFGKVISINGKTNIIFDGVIPCGKGTTCAAIEAANPTGYASGQAGIIEATANGSALAHQNVQTQAFADSAGSGTIEIKNLILRNLYQHTSLSDSTSSADTGNFIFQCPFTTGCAAGTISIHDSDIHDNGNAISFQRGSATTINIYNNEFWHNNWAMENSGNGTRTIYFHDNHIHDAKNWDTTLDTFHHNSLHNFMNVASDSLGLYYYNNLSDGDWGACCTTALGSFTETAHPANFFEFNNVAIQSCNTNTAPVFDYGGISSAHGATLYNNTFLGCASTAANVRAYDVSGTSVVSENNADQNFGQYVVVNTGATLTTFDFNVYGPIGISGNPAWQCTSTGAANFTAWKATSCIPDTNGQKVSSLGVDANGVPQAGSALIGGGANLFSICNGQPIPGIGALCNDKAGLARPSVGAWDAGAFNFTGAAPNIVVSPTSLNFGSVVVGTTSPGQTVTVQNTGTSTLTFSSITVGGATFSFVFPVGCQVSTPLAPGGSCTIGVTATPSTATTVTGTLTINSNDPGTPSFTVPLSVTGIANSPAVSLSPPVLSFPNQVVGTTSSPLTVHLTNSGAATLNISSIAMAGATDYSISSNCGPTLGAGSSCDVLAYFTPSSTGLKSGSIVFTTNASSSPDSVPISGTGVNASAVVCPKFSGGVSIKGGVQFKCQ